MSAERGRRYVAFLRAINVGGHTVKMDALKRMFTELEFANVSTFIASGNVLFESERKDTAALEKQIEAHLEENLGYRVATFLRPTSELSGIANRKVFTPELLADPDNSLYIGFMASPPADEAKKRLTTFRSPYNDFHVHGREMYWLIRGKLTDSTVTGAKLEKALATPVTLRNVTTIRRLAALHTAAEKTR
jgi:uncharacterized protein (DUF1697 family)